MGKIKLLDDNIINLIAAGEVVERPASIIKELMENSIDAGAHTIVVKAYQGGMESIVVEDDGSGMDKDDALLAFKQHATSKIESQADLENIITLGFRGEALASISSVAEIELETKTSETDPVKLRVVKGVPVILPSARSNSGTTITINNLFKDVPARRKFLRSESTEIGYIQTAFLSVALVNLGIHFELYHNDKLQYRLPATQNFADRVFNIWDTKVAENLFNTELEHNNVKVTAYPGSPDIARGDRKLQFLFVNGRHISDRLLQKAVTEAYQGFIHRDLQPVYFLMLNLPPELVDVNVHPRKQEVRFRDSGAVFNLVRNTIQQALNKSTRQELMERISSADTAGESDKQVSDFTSKPAGNNWQLNDNRSRYSGGRTNNAGNIQRSLDFTSVLLDKGTELPESPGSYLNSAAYVPAGQYLQIFATYIVYQNNNEVIFVDQHAAAEKILYEKLAAQLDLNRSKPLLVPEVVELDKHAKAKVLELQPQLAIAGFNVEDFGGNAIQVTAIPEIIPSIAAQPFLEALVQAAEESGNDELPLRDDIKHYIVATMACHGAIRAGQSLSQPEMQQLISDLAKCQSPYNCPHGRPVSWTLSKYDLEKGFKRTI
jgi:DNA mismatch repair protein MutL